jgi:hypothetical protein
MSFASLRVLFPRCRKEWLSGPRWVNCNLGLQYPDVKSRPLPLDGAVGIDNIVSEHETKRVVFRKNSLFVGNARGGRAVAILASLTSTCRRHDLDPQLYLTQLLTNLVTVRRSELPNWLPDQWKQLQAPRFHS